jgi:hypothetical protein
VKIVLNLNQFMDPLKKYFNKSVENQHLREMRRPCGQLMAACTVGSSTVEMVNSASSRSRVVT